MSDLEWQSYLLYGRLLRVRQEKDCWRLRQEEREVSAPHLDGAFAELLNVPSHVALHLALSVLNAEPGAEIT